MDKEQILELSRQENKDQDFFELDVNCKAQRLGGIIAIIVTIVCILCEHLDLHGDAHSSYLLILTSGLTGMWGIRVAKLRRKHEMAVLAVVALLLAYAAVMFIKSILR